MCYVTMYCALQVSGIEGVEPLFVIIQTENL